MNRLTFAAAALAAAAVSFGANASEQKPQADTKCYLLGCYDKEGKRVDAAAPAAVKTAMAGNRTAAKPAATNTATSRYSSIIVKHATANGVPVNLAHAVIRIESNFRANARGRAGEVGLMQIKPATARAMGYSGSVKGLYNPETNIKYGMKYLGQARKLGDGSVCGTILKYNAGHGAKRMNRISAAYCSKVKKHLGIS
ncbi:transglycosylase SLT domain-containing protein [Mesorhizobium sp. Z1-4]|uniref:lytic transglycosylase domain-containing protein n=1 Tax=Mesorhizobium sp. Z1-4 TaxID=2448478 RepID=UPI000FDB3525|nr:transglycosylase SLT domain-containing protein [Mesorhizobium sp. Z1-4]